MVMVDDCHATGHLGPHGRGAAALAGETLRVDIVTGTFGKTLGGGMGGFIAASQPVVDLLRQRARPYLFSNSLAPPVAAGSLKAIEICEAADDLRARLMAHTARFREGLAAAGFALLPGETPIIPVMLHEASRAQAMARALDERGIYVAGFFFPRRAEGAGAHPHPDVCRAHDSGRRSGDRRLPGGGSRTRRDLIARSAGVRARRGRPG